MIERQNRSKEYRNQKRMEAIEEKDKKIEEYKRQREKLAERKANMAIEIQKQKEEVIRKFDRLIKQKKEVDCELIKELFPEDEELYNKIKAMQEEHQKYMTSETNETKDDKEIERKVEEYRNKLRAELDRTIREEKEKENERVKAYESETDPTRKQELEKENARQRADGNAKVTKMQSDIESKVKQYEQSLRKGH